MLGKLVGCMSYIELGLKGTGMLDIVEQVGFGIVVAVFVAEAGFGFGTGCYLGTGNSDIGKIGWVGCSCRSSIDQL